MHATTQHVPSCSVCMFTDTLLLSTGVRGHFRPASSFQSSCQIRLMHFGAAGKRVGWEMDKARRNDMDQGLNYSVGHPASIPELNYDEIEVHESAQASPAFVIVYDHPVDVPQ